MEGSRVWGIESTPTPTQLVHAQRIEAALRGSFISHSRRKRIRERDTRAVDCRDDRSSEAIDGLTPRRDIITIFVVEAEQFQEHRSYLMSIAYRMLGSQVEAEDAVQETWLRYQSNDATEISNLRAWLSKVLVRLCVDMLKSARARRETYPGGWLPEPVVTSNPIDVGSIRFGFLVLLERLDPRQRAVFLLNQVFDYSHDEIARILEITEELSRQSLHRAKEHVAAERPRFEANPETHQRLLSAFLNTLAQGDVDGLSKLIAADASLQGEHAEGQRGAILRPILGRSNIARFFVASAAKSPASSLDVQIEEINGWPGVVGRRSGTVAFVVTIETRGEEIVVIRSMMNPKKLHLRHVN
jgi:RNA polymerase sigma-70 factor, ECF subfamily